MMQKYGGAHSTMQSRRPRYDSQKQAVECATVSRHRSGTRRVGVAEIHVLAANRLNESPTPVAPAA